MAIVNVSNASGVVLDCLVQECELKSLKQPELGMLIHKIGYGKPVEKYSSNWNQGGPIIEREGISWHCGNKSSWHAYGYGSADNISGHTPLIAAMRCYVASKLGENVDVPDELLKEGE